jgi:hypothetical protein
VPKFGEPSAFQRTLPDHAVVPPGLARLGVVDASRLAPSGDVVKRCVHAEHAVAPANTGRLA